MKKFLMPLLAVFLVVGFVGSVYAYPQVYLKESGVSPANSHTFYFHTLGDVGGVLYGEYDLMIDWDMDVGGYNYVSISGFCVENAYSTKLNGIIYDLIDPGDLDNPYTTEIIDKGEGYLEAAYILSQYRAGNISAQAGQIAVWEAVFDPEGYDFTGGRFHFTIGDHDSPLDQYADEAWAFLDQMNTGSFSGSGYKIAHNPAGDQTNNYQDYVVHVPDASILFLLGPALLSLGLLGWRRKKV